MSRQDPPHHDQPEAGQPSASDPVFLVLGEILRPHGVRGELRLRILTAYPERVAQLETVFIGDNPYDDTTATAFQVEGTRRHRDYLLVRLANVQTRDQADQYRGQLLMVSLADAIPLTDGEYYVYQIIGATVVTVDGKELGQVRGVLETGANDVFIIEGLTGEEILIPDVPHVVVDVDLQQKRLTIDPLLGLLPT